MKMLIEMFSRNEYFHLNLDSPISHERAIKEKICTVFPDYSESELYKRIVRTDTPPPEVFR